MDKTRFTVFKHRMTEKELKRRIVEAAEKHGLRCVQAALVFEGLAPNMAQKLSEDSYPSTLRELSIRAVKRALASLEERSSA